MTTNHFINQRVLWLLIPLLTLFNLNAWGGVRSGWTRVTTVKEITDGGTFIVGFESTANSNTIVPMINKPSTLTAVDGSGTSYLYSGTTSTSNNTTINMSDKGSGATTSYEFEFVTGSSSGTISIKLSDNTYVGFYGSSNNNCKRYSSVSTNSSFTPTITTNDVVTLTNVQYTGRKLRYNSSSNYRFSNYSTAGNVVLYKKASSCDKSVGVTKGSESHGEVTTIGSASVATCSATASDRRVTITVTPDDCYDAPSTLTWTKSSGTVSASKQSGPTDNGDGTYSYVYQFAQNDNGAGTFGVTCTAKAAGKTVNFNAGPGSCLTSSLTETCDGSGVTLPAVTATGVCKGWTTFAGWATAAVSDSTTTSGVTLYAAGDNFVPASNGQTLYAVYSKNKGGGGASTSTLTNSSIVSSGNSSGYKTYCTSGCNKSPIDGWSGKFAVNYVSSGTHYSVQLGRATTSGASAYNTHLTSPTYASGATHISLTLSTSASQVTANGRKFYLMDTDELNYTAADQTSSYGVGTYDNSDDNYEVSFDVTGSPTQFHIYADGTAYIKTITVTYGGSTTYYCSDPNCCTALGSINGSFSWTNGQATVSWDAAGGCDSWGLKYKRHADSDIPANWTSYAGSFGTATGRTSNSTAISGLTAGTEYDFKITGTSDGSVYCAGTVTETKSSTVPKITASSAMTDLGYQEGETPVAQTFTITGTQLTGNLTVTAPSNFLVSLDGSSWSAAGGSKTVTVSTPPNNLGSTTIHVKANSGLLEGADPSGNITISGGGAASVNVAVSATITEACTAPSSVTITGTTKYFGGQTISLTATPSGGAGEASYQWQKKVSGVWTNVANGGGISGATTNNLQITSCTHGNSGGYRCVVSTGTTCSTKSHADDNAGYGVHVYSIYGRYYNEGEWAHNEIAYTSGTTGTATVHLSAKKTYTFKVRSNNDLYYGNSSGNFIIQPATNMDCGTNNSEIRLFTTIEGDYTITVDIAHGLDNSPYVTIAVSYPSMTHPNSGYVYVQKFSWRPYLHYWYDNSNKLTEWGSDPQLNSDQYTTICGTEYWCVPVIDYYCNFIAKDAAGDPSNTTGDQHTNSPHPGQKLYNDGSWKWAAIPTYTISYAGGTGSTGSMSSELSIIAGSDQTLTAFNTITKAGYTFSCWHANQDVTIGGSTVNEGDDISDGATIQNVCGNITLTAQWTANTNTAYTVKHYQQNIANDDYTEVTGDRQNLIGTTDASVTPAVKSYTGFTAPSTQTVTILGDGSRVVDYYYTRNSYNLTWNLGGGTTTTAGTGIASGVSVNATSSVKYGTSLTAPTVTKTGYGFSAWSPSAPASTMPAAATTYTATWSATNYTITYNLNSGTNPGGAPTGFTIESSAIALPTPTRAGYTFDGWYAASNFSGDVQTTIAAGSTGNKEYWAKWTAKTDTYKTALHTGASGWTSYASGVTKSGAGYTIPAPSSVTKGATSSCEDTHYYFAGWVADDYKGSPSGHIITATGTTDATGTTYWAVWKKEAAGSGTGSEELTESEITTNITNTTCAYGTEKTYTDNSKIAYAFSCWTDAASRKWVQMKKEDSGVYIEITAPGNISQVDLTITAAENSSGGVNDISKHTKLPAATVLNLNTAKTNGTSKRVAYVAGDGSSTSRTITVSSPANATLYLQPTGGACRIWGIKVYYSTITYEDPKAVCEACVATPSISGVSLTGSAFSTTSVPVQATGASAGDNCSLASYGFYWGASADPSTNNTSSNNLSTGTFSATLTGPFETGTTYHYRAYATNEGDNTGYSSDATFTLHNVTFNMHDHGDAKAAQVVPEGGKVTNPGNPSATGWTFGGWYDNDSYTGSAWDFSTNTVGSGNVTLHAKWTEKPKYTITLNAGNGTISDGGWTNTSGSVYTKTQSNGDEEITLPTPSCNCAGWVFQGWSTTSKDNAASFTPDKADGASFTPASDVTYYAVYRQSTPSGTTYTKITDEAALTTGDYLIVAYSSYYYAMGNSITSGHMTETSSSNATSWSNPSATLVWTIIKVGDKVGFYNASAGDNAGKYLTIVDGAWVLADDGQLFTYSFNNTTKAWTFTSPSGKQMRYASYYYVGDEQSSPIYLYKRGDAESGNYYTNPSCSDYSVTGVANPAAGGTVQLTAAAAKSGDKVWACYTADPEYDFTSWSISGTGVSPTSATTQFVAITVGSGDVTAQANFAAKVMYNVTWKANNVALTGDDLGSASVRVEDGHKVTTLPPTPSSCDDASTTFMGWVADGDVWSGKTDDVSDVTIYTKASDLPTVTGDVTYHAVWAKRNGSAAPATYAGTGVFTKITTMEELEVGAHYVLYGEKADDNTINGAMNNTFSQPSSGKYIFGRSAVTISDNKITNPSTTVVWKLGGEKDAYTLYSQNSSKYVEITIGDARGYSNPSSPTTSFTIDVNEGVFRIMSNHASAGGRMICLYNGTEFRSYANNNTDYVLYLYKYGNNYTYDNYLVKCCTDPELVFDGEYNYQTLVRQDIHGAHGGNGSATAEQGKATLVLDYSTESDGTCTVEVKKLTGGDNRSTAVAGSDCSNHTNIAINESTKKVTFDVWTYAGSYPTANGQGTYRIKITQAATSTYCEAVTYYFVDVTLRDKFVDAVNGNTTINVDGQSKTTSDKCKTPTEASLDADKNDDCHSTTRRFLGWVREDNMDTWYVTGNSTRVSNLDDKKEDAAIVAPNADIITSGSTWYAVWGEEVTE